MDNQEDSQEQRPLNVAPRVDIFPPSRGKRKGDRSSSDIQFRGKRRFDSDTSRQSDTSHSVSNAVDPSTSRPQTSSSVSTHKLVPNNSSGHCSPQHQRGGVSERGRVSERVRVSDRHHRKHSASPEIGEIRQDHNNNSSNQHRDRSSNDTKVNNHDHDHDNQPNSTAGNYQHGSNHQSSDARPSSRYDRHPRETSNYQSRARQPRQHPNSGSSSLASDHLQGSTRSGWSHLSTARHSPPRHHRHNNPPSYYPPNHTSHHYNRRHHDNDPPTSSVTVYKHHHHERSSYTSTSLSVGRRLGDSDTTQHSRRLPTDTEPSPQPESSSAQQQSSCGLGLRPSDSDTMKDGNLWNNVNSMEKHETRDVTFNSSVDIEVVRRTSTLLLTPDDGPREDVLSDNEEPCPLLSPERDTKRDTKRDSPNSRDVSTVRSRSVRSRSRSSSRSYDYSDVKNRDTETDARVSEEDDVGVSPSSASEGEESSGTSRTNSLPLDRRPLGLVGQTVAEDVPISVESGNPLLYGCGSVDKYKRLNKISEGTYGAVYRAQHLQTRKIVALKHVKYHERLWEEGFPLTSLREISILLELHHPNIVNVIEVVVGENPNQVFMVMEYIEHELKLLLEDNRPQFSISERKRLMLQLLEAVDYLHSHWVMHRDLKTSNLLYSNKGELKICDFGMARKYGDPIKPSTHNVVTMWYRAPELLLGQETYTTAIDIWSVGCIMGEILSRRPLFDGRTESQTLDKIFKLCGTPSEKSWPGMVSLPAKNRLEFSKHHPPSWRSMFPAPRPPFTDSSAISDAGLDLLQSLLCLDPEKRITAREALAHPFFDEKPLPQRLQLMPTAPDTNQRDRATRHAEDSLNEQDLVDRDIFHGQLESRYTLGTRVDPKRYLIEMETAAQLLQQQKQQSQQQKEK